MCYGGFYFFFQDRNLPFKENDEFLSEYGSECLQKTGYFCSHLGFFSITFFVAGPVLMVLTAVFSEPLKCLMCGPGGGEEWGRIFTMVSHFEKKVFFTLCVLKINDISMSKSLRPSDYIQKSSIYPSRHHYSKSPFPMNPPLSRIQDHSLSDLLPFRFPGN